MIMQTTSQYSQSKDRYNHQNQMLLNFTQFDIMCFARHYLNHAVTAISYLFAYAGSNRIKYRGCCSLNYIVPAPLVHWSSDFFRWNYLGLWVQFYPGYPNTFGQGDFRVCLGSLNYLAFPNEPYLAKYNIYMHICHEPLKCVNSHLIVCIMDMYIHWCIFRWRQSIIIASKTCIILQVFNGFQKVYFWCSLVEG